MASKPPLSCCGQGQPQPLCAQSCPPPGTWNPSRPGLWGRGSPKLALGPCQVLVDVACMPASPSQCPHLCLVPDPLGCGLSMQPASPAIHIPGPRFCSKYSSALPPAHSSTEADICSSCGGLPVPLLCHPRSAPPMHRPDWPENRSSGCSDHILPTLGAPTAPSCYFQVASPGGWARLWRPRQRSEELLVGGGEG